MIHHISDIQLGSNNEATIFFFGDLQSDADGFLSEAWDEFKKEFLATPNSYAMGLGDYGDFSRPTMRARLLSSLANDDSSRRQLDNMVRKNQDRLLDKMQFLEGRLIGIHNGHHCWEFADGTNSDQRLACALKAPYLGWMASTRLRVHNRKKDRSHGWSYTMISLHGNANARKSGGVANWTEDNIVKSWIADQYVLGHCCKGMTWVPSERNTVRRDGPAGVICQLPRCLQVPGFHSGFAESGGYVERFSFPPQPPGWGVLRLRLLERDELRELNGGIGKRSKFLAPEQHIRYFEK